MKLTRDETFKVVLNIRTPQPDGSTEVGTGMFLLKNDNMPYILTASHVAKKSSRLSCVVISDANSNSQSILLEMVAPNLNWVHHQSADVSVLPLQLDISLISTLQGRFFPISQLNLSKISPSRDAYLTCVGFPNGLGAENKFSPFTFRSHASSSLITFNRADSNSPSEFFTLENPSVGGYSGGPVFDLGYVIVGSMKTDTGPTICHGIMHGTISDNTGGKIAVVTPSYYVKDIL